jgi:two-component system OmpR family sensor kinase
MRSFRSALALRVAAQALVLVAVLAAGAMLLLRSRLISSLDAALLEVAEVEANAATTAASAEFHFRPGSFRKLEVDSSPAMVPSAQLLTADGAPVARSANLSEDLPVPPRALAAALRGAVGYETQVRNGRPIRSTVYPLSRIGPAHRAQLLQVSASLTPVETTLTSFVRQVVVFGVAGTVLAWLMGLWIAGRALRPARALALEAESIEVSELGRRVTEPGEYGEFHRIAVALNVMLARVERAVTGTQRFTADASHELRAPLTVLRGELELALSRPRSAPEYEEVIRRCLDEVLRLTRLADDMLTLARVEGGVLGAKRGPVDLDEIVDRALGKKSGLAESRRVELDVSGAAGEVSADPDLLLRAVDSLLEHAIMASPPGGRVRVVLADTGSRSVEVTDSGPGLKEEEIPGVFQRFYRSGRPRAHSAESGLGLPIARAIAERYGGAVDYVGNAPGASFRLSLPGGAPPSG